ncbi:otoraplin [Callorhinchus milii]|uniref:otoraplin n=1 Tax=Callorhinchus milii TaxID=7868 RepID=UPI001C3F5060|nr:otoraplin [Callorhinchus milii]XP_042189353.1 otoraplin [Callorhinchus milii]
MAQLAFYLSIILLVFLQAVTADFMDRLAEKKLCVDEECIYVISIAQVMDDYIAPDCRFLNLRRGQLLYVYTKLVPESESGEFWSGSIYSTDEYVDQMGIVGYFPNTTVEEQHVFQKAKLQIATTAIDFFCD